MNPLDHLAELMAKSAMGALHYDNAGTTIFEDSTSGPQPTFDVRGWGWLQKLPNGEDIQDARGELVAVVINALPALLEVAKAAAGYKASVEALQDAMADIGEDGDLWTFEDRHAAARDALAAALAKLPKETT